ncbi:diguanylate cyclase [Labrys okinawensis]|uniref:diguanylate cyclase n=1 Tax=Labrys okinawensis TaxID=346911 RepID=A0A2S9QI42_9HYPH|nr:GGDEF domain-containing protein [Labrys okinawensis]PRH89029.1 diguanylate cyclase [Labrys okinawensis]
MNEVLSRLVAGFDQSAIFIALYDQFDRLRYANAAFRSAFFIEEHEEPTWPEIMRRNFEAGRGTVLRIGNFDEWLISTQSRRGKIAFRAYETDLVDGRWLWMKESVLDDGWMLCVASDITALHAHTRDLRQDRDSAVKVAYTDELTGVANRRFVMARIEDMLRRQGATGGPVGCLAILDIDNFKTINDRYGHPAGDQILRALASTISSGLRRVDCFGRVGGEEFVLVMPRTDGNEAVLILERMLARVRVSQPLKDHRDLRITFSAGVTEAASEDIALSLYARADKALYQAKMLGRNCIVLSAGGEEDLSANG